MCQNFVFRKSIILRKKDILIIQKISKFHFKQGFEHVDDILTLIFQYLNLLRQSGPQKWIFDEYSKLSEMQFRFKDKENPLNLVSNIVHSMIVYPLPEVFSANYLLTEWRPDLIGEVLEKLNPYNSRIIIVGQKHKDKCSEEEFWYKTNYYYEKIEQAAIDVSFDRFVLKYLTNLTGS